VQPLSINIEPTALDQVDQAWLPGLKPYAYQAEAYRYIRQALESKETRCLFLVSPTGSGKTLASYACTILHQEPAFGAYPTNELIRDQERALLPWIDPARQYRLLRIDSAMLDDWQTKLELQRHSETLERVMRWEPTILTNPDILFYAFFGLYGGPEGIGARLFTLIGRYRLFIFDEFHLYNVKQMADVALLVSSLHAINPNYGRVFLFASATPDSPALAWMRDRLQLPVEVIEAKPSIDPQARQIAYPVQLTILPADLRGWKGAEALAEYLPTLQQFFQIYPQVRMVTILDSVAGAIKLAQELRCRFPDRSVGEVHGFSSDEERSTALRRSFTIGTSTIEVGIDFKDEAEKDVLIFESRTASQFIQRLGRLARHAKHHPNTPNWAVALVPDYVYHFLSNCLNDQSIARTQLYQLIEEAYQKPEDFSRYLQVHAPAEFQAAVAKILTLFQPDDRPRVQDGLSGAVHALTGKSAGAAWALYRRYQETDILAPLLTFRGSGFEVAVLDERGTDPGFPAKRYDLLFLLRRGVLELADEETYLKKLDELAERWPELAAHERRYSKLIARAPDQLLGVYGHFILKGLLDKGRKVWFEVSEEQVSGRRAQVTVVEGLEIATEPEIHLRRLNSTLRKKRIVAWFTDRHPASIKLGHALPPLFEIHELRVRRPGGAPSKSPWSIAFNQDAFFVDSLGWSRDQRKEDEALIV
jgi:CRISPR-associated endonuclease/helicase Cas3